MSDAFATLAELKVVPGVSVRRDARYKNGIRSKWKTWSVQVRIKQVPFGIVLAGPYPTEEEAKARHAEIKARMEAEGTEFLP